MSIEYPNGFSQPEMSRKPICGVLAIAVCASVDYQVAHAACKRNMPNHRQRFRGATFPTQQLKALDELAVRYVQVLVQGWRLCDLIRERFEPGVLYMVTVPGHVVTVKDGFVCDQGGIKHWSVSKSAGRSVSAAITCG